MRPRHLVFALFVLEAGLLCLTAATAQAQSVTVTAEAQTLCGDGIVQSPEQCDGVNLNGSSCGSLGYSGGTLTCASNCVFVTGQCTSPPPAGGNNRNNDVPFSLDELQTSVIISGRAHPFATIVISEGSAVRTSFSADATSKFQTTLVTTPGLHSYSVYGLDKNGRRSPQYPFRITVNPNVVNAVTGIFLPPTIGVDRSTVKKGIPLGVAGLTVPQGVVSVYIDSAEGSSVSATTKSDGAYSLSLDTSSFTIGSHTVRARVTAPDLVASDFSQALSFTVGEQAVCDKKTGDLNCDGEVDLVDLSTLLYWWRTSASEGLTAANLNQDDNVDLIDLSIMLAHWTA